MDSKLTEDEISALRAFAEDSAFDDGNRIEAALPDRLFSFNLVAHDQSGITTLTKHGERALFHYICVSGLAAIGRGEPTGLPVGAVKWLRSSGFIKTSAEGERIAISTRGRLWLASLEVDDAHKSCRVITSEHFARRRSCGNG